MHRANKHFFALEYLESQFTLSFLRELQKQDRCASYIWLHDGLWVDKDLCNSIIHGAERLAAQVVPLLRTYPLAQGLISFRLLRTSHLSTFLDDTLSLGLGRNGLDEGKQLPFMHVCSSVVAIRLKQEGWLPPILFAGLTDRRRSYLPLSHD